MTSEYRHFSNTSTLHFAIIFWTENDQWLLNILEQSGGGGSPSPCMNGGTFKTLQNKCECEPEFTGRNCETGQFTKTHMSIQL